MTGHDRAAPPATGGRIICFIQYLQFTTDQTDLGSVLYIITGRCTADLIALNNIMTIKAFYF